MKATVKKTGEVVEVHYWYQKSSTKEHIYRESSDLRDERSWSENELDFNFDKINWEQRRFELVKAAMQGWVASEDDRQYTIQEVIDIIFPLADAVIAKLKEE